MCYDPKGSTFEPRLKTMQKKSLEFLLMRQMRQRPRKVLKCDNSGESFFIITLLLARILHPSNVDKEKLMEYAIKAAQFSTEWRSKKLPHTEWSRIPRGPPPGVPDVCIFDFTNLYAARVAARVNVRKGQPLLSMIVGDSLLEPFWPEGTGCARGFLSAMDAGWMMRDWFLGQKNPLKILAEREMTR